MRSCFTRGRRWARFGLLASFAALVAGGSCTQVQVEETQAIFANSTCRSDNAGGGNPGGGNNNNNGGGATQSLPAGQMDTYIVQIFELNDGESTAQSSCDTCLATRSNCFFETASCVCGAPVDVSPAVLPQVLQDVRVPVPAKYNSLYCLRVMAVQRAADSQPEQCQCDSAWEAPSKVRLCSLSKPYAASSFPVSLTVQCPDNRSFSTCLGQTPPAN